MCAGVILELLLMIFFDYICTSIPVVPASPSTHLLFFSYRIYLLKKKKRTESVKVPDLPQKRFRHMNTDTGLYGLKVSAPLTAKREFSVCSKYRGCVILLVLSKYFRIIQGIIYLYTCLMCNQTVRKKMFLVPGSSLQNRFQNNK